MDATDTVKVFWDGARKFGIATAPHEAQFFLPGSNDVPRAVWAKLTGDPTCSVNIHLKNGKLRLAPEEIQSEENLGKLSAESAVMLIGETMGDEAQLYRMREQEQGRLRGPRKTVMDALDEQLGKFKKIDDGPKDSGKRPLGGRRGGIADMGGGSAE